MSEQDSKSEGAPRYSKGDRAAIVSGKQAIGVRGAIFWSGPNKFGAGHRYGLRGDDGATYWVDEADLGAEDGAPPAPEREASPALARGSRVRITGGKSGVGKECEVFWVGESRYGPGHRYGVKDDNQETHWVDDSQVEPLAGGGPLAAGAASGARSSGAPDAEDFQDDDGGRTSGPQDFQDDDWPGDDDFADAEPAEQAPDSGDIPF